MTSFHFAKNKFVGALALESVLPRRVRKKISALLIVGTVALAIFSVLLPIGFSAIASLLPLPVFAALAPIFSLEFRIPFGLLILLLPFLFLLAALDGFWNSKTFVKGGDAKSADIANRLNFYVSGVWWHGPRFSHSTTESIFLGLARAKIGRHVLMRIGVDEKSFGELMSASSENWKPISVFVETLAARVPAGSDITLPEFLKILFEEHPFAKSFLDVREIPLSTLRRVAHWLERSFAEEDMKHRWWLWENLNRVQGIGKSWSYSQTPTLEQFARDIEGEALRASETDLIGKDREIKLLESALLKDSGANIILVGEPGSGRHTTLMGLVRMIAWGSIFPELEDKRVLRLQGSVLVGAGKTKGEIEALFLSLLNEATRAGNIILAIDEFPEFVDSLAKAGVNAGEILATYLASPAIHILAVADTLGFRKTIENNAGLMKYFERVEISEPDEARLLEILEDYVPRVEYTHPGLLFTYAAVERIAKGSTENLVAGALPKRAIDLMEEVADGAALRGTQSIDPDLVTEFITQKTKMPMGDISSDEQQKLMNLETHLQKRVIGQDEAVKAVADAIRRARSGIKNPKRPIGSFLFMGPTGVGKTETAKSLAENYFGNEEAMLRFDMTEYQNEEGFEKLVGSFEKNEPGLLTSRMRASPYALVLLDEFEKSNLKVKNLFLQVLDEGFFTDYLGRKVNMRNTIIIATSNAGARLIWESVEKGIDPSTLRNELFSTVQKEGLYTPELLNRFDAVIIYRPLSREVLTKIARSALEKFSLRLKTSKNIMLEISDLLVEAVAKGGFDPVFGARPMQRFIQDKVEKLVADKIIRGEVKSGSTFPFTEEEIAGLL